MKNKSRAMSAFSLEMQNSIKQSAVSSTLCLAKALSEDEDITQRREQSLCLYCYYAPRFGRPAVAGAAITSEPCMCCNELQTYSSTKTDPLCLACAKLHHLCKHCGADVDLCVSRKDWPSFDGK